MTFFAPVRRLTAGKKRGEGSGLRSFFLVALVLATLACDREAKVVVAAPATPEIGVQSQASASASKPILLSKDSGFWGFQLKNLPRTSGEPFLTAHSPTWIAKAKDIESQVAAISDPNLREAKRSKLWGLVDKVACQQEAEAAYIVANQAYQSARAAYFAKHIQDWYELAHYSTYRAQEERVVFEGTKANLLDQREFQVPLPIQDMDRLYSQFKSSEREAITAAANAEWNKATALGGDPVAYYTNNGLSVAEAKEMIAKEQGRIWNRHEEEARSKGLLLVGQVDPKSGRVNRLAFMSYNTQEVLMELPGEAVAVVIPMGSGGL